MEPLITKAALNDRSKPLVVTTWNAMESKDRRIVTGFGAVRYVARIGGEWVRVQLTQPDSLIVQEANRARKNS